jgi:hypothetical protein
MVNTALMAAVLANRRRKHRRHALRPLPLGTKSRSATKDHALREILDSGIC